MIVRVRGKKGQSRFTIGERMTLAELLEEVAAKFQISSPLGLARQRDGGGALSGPNELVSSMTTHGEELYMILEKTPILLQETPQEYHVDEVDYKLRAKSGTVIVPEDCGPNRTPGTYDPFDPKLLKEWSPEAIKFMSFHSYLRMLETSDKSGAGVILEEQRTVVNKSCYSCPGWPRGMCSRCQPSAVRLKRQPYRHVDYLEFVSRSALQVFIDRWRETGFQRVGYMIGRYAEYSMVPLGIKAEVVAIYEPPQEQSPDSIELFEDKHASLVDRLAEALGLQRIGIIFTDLQVIPGEDPAHNTAYTRYASANNSVLSGTEILTAAHFQTQYPLAVDKRHNSTGTFGSRFITCVISGNEYNAIEPKAYMASDQAMALVRGDCLRPSRDMVDHVCVKASDDVQYVPEVLYDKKNEYDRLVTHKADPFIPSDYLFVDFPIGTRLSDSEPLEFPVANRGVAEDEILDSIGVEALARHFNQPRSLLDKMDNFHLLMYLARNKICPLAAVMDELLVAVRNKDEPAIAAWCESTPEYRTLEMLWTESLKNSGSGGSAGSSGHSSNHASDAGRKWACAACTFLNSGNTTVCSVCGTAR